MNEQSMICYILGVENDFSISFLETLISYT